MIIDNVLYYSFRFFICFANLTLKTALLLVYLYIIVYFLTKVQNLYLFLWRAMLFLPDRRGDTFFLFKLLTEVCLISKSYSFCQVT